MSVTYSTAQRALEKAGGNRPVARELVRQEIMTEARELAARAARSLKCQRGVHSHDPYGCANDGSGCLCACHDGGAL